MEIIKSNELYVAKTQNHMDMDQNPSQQVSWWPLKAKKKSEPVVVDSEMAAIQSIKVKNQEGGLFVGVTVPINPDEPNGDLYLYTRDITSFYNPSIFPRSDEAKLEALAKAKISALKDIEESILENDQLSMKSKNTSLWKIIFGNNAHDFDKPKKELRLGPPVS